MFILAFLIGIYSYIIFFLGLFGLLYQNFLILLTVLFWVPIIIWFIKNKWQSKGITLVKNKLILFFIILFGFQAIVNLIGALGPELAFDALWYHLTLPKIYLETHSIFFIPGGLFYYSAMPKLGEMLYIAGLFFGGEVVPKLIHFSFGLLTCLALYKLSRKFFTPLISIIAITIFYSNLVVGWQSITAYIDLIRAFFEIMALWAFINWQGTKVHSIKNERKWLIWSAVMLGFAISSKLLAVGSLVIFVILIILKSWKRLLHFARNDVVNIFLFISISLAIPLPWFIFSYISTGSPVYPFFSDLYKIAPEPFSMFGFIKEIWILFAKSADPISPIYIMFLPLFILFWKKIKKTQGILEIGIYSILAIIIWYFTPRTGGGRFIIPYLPALSILCAFCISEIVKNTKTRFIGNFLIFITILISLISIGYRFVANAKYLPVILGKETREKFLENHLNFSFGDFYDVDGYFKTHIKLDDKVLLIGFHNLYYVDFPYIDLSRSKFDEKFNYIATQNTNLPEKYKNWKLIYENNKTMVKLYKQ